VAEIGRRRGVMVLVGDRMNLRRSLSCVLALSASICAIASPASATFTHYYYDAQGRLLAALSTAHEQRTSRTDNADNPSYLHVFAPPGRSVASTLPAGASLIADQYLTSSDGRFTFLVQEDGTAAIYESGVTPALWSTPTFGAQPGYFQLDANGNLAYYGPNDAVLWSSGQSPAPTAS
jgi:hypothetical protein